MEDFKSQYTFEERKMQTELIKQKHPNRIPVYVYKHRKSKYDDIAKHKFLVPDDITVGQFVYIIRKHLKLESDQGIFIFVDNVLPPTGDIMCSLYSKYSDPDGFLYIAFSHESAFG